MHSIYFGPEHHEFRRNVRRFVENEIAPHADQWEQARAIPRQAFRRMGELGFLGVCFPEEYGGAEGDIFMAMALLEELARSRMGGFAAAVAVQQFMAPQHIHKYGSEELKRKYLAGSISGEMVGALGVTEPGAGSDVAAIRAKASRQGDHYLINGAKTFITNGADGHFITLACKTEPGAGARGISLIVVDLDAPGVSCTRRLEKMGWHASDTAELTFEDVRAPLANLVGQENKGFYYIMQAFQLERLACAAMGLGLAQLCLEHAVKYMGERNAFGAPLSNLQALAHRLAELSARQEAARQLTYHAAWLYQNDLPCVAQCSMAKLLACELAKRVADECLQFFGGYGLMEEYPMARLLRDSRLGTIVAGTSEVMREIIARLSFGRADYK
ncbi:Isovaleryl-CoA dehydrogenase [Desulfarculus baarsii DSM 2075]|uniref:Isovaleryl-CoA dehydrogenase n=1 Tax=Desulfarculus baarsii (strain ATCC 33931 / DSM 2075 / LMG 7858 / VKM B-1802 / 2st14) TaxID=644282 RepID=E1QD91_DESB2|nr:acyl-CoA dehydrogenase family protein [Desulfarculus baarsii]ADK83410.1 Isovaleryl-CoA dehydrogenase [Desulfarculus baarsii DSM 2075]